MQIRYYRSRLRERSEEVKHEMSFKIGPGVTKRRILVYSILAVSVLAAAAS